MLRPAGPNLKRPFLMSIRMKRTQSCAAGKEREARWCCHVRRRKGWRWWWLIEGTQASDPTRSEGAFALVDAAAAALLLASN